MPVIAVEISNWGRVGNVGTNVMENASSGNQWITESLTVALSQGLEVKYIGGIDPRMLFLENGVETEVSK